MNTKFIQEQEYIKTKNRVKEIKAFYLHLIVSMLSLPIAIGVNLIFVPHFYFFWFAVFGVVFSLVIHWLTVFKFSKHWEENKIKQIMKENNKYN